MAATSAQYPGIVLILPFSSQLNLILHLYGCYLLGKQLFQWVRVCARNIIAVGTHGFSRMDRHSPWEIEEAKTSCMGDTQETSATLKSKAAGVRMFSEQPTALCPRCSQPGTYSVPGFPPWPLFFWLPPNLLTLLLTPGVPLQQQMWLLEQRGHWLADSTQQWEQALCFALQGQWVGWAQPG